MYPTLYKLPGTDTFINLAHLIVVRWKEESNMLCFDLMDNQYHSLRCADREEASKIIAEIQRWLAGDPPAKRPLQYPQIKLQSGEE